MKTLPVTCPHCNKTSQYDPMVYIQVGKALLEQDCEDNGQYVEDPSEDYDDEDYDDYDGEKNYGSMHEE